MNCKVMRAGRQHRGVCEGNVPSQFAILCARTPLNPTQTHHHSPLSEYIAHTVVCMYSSLGKSIFANPSSVKILRIWIKVVFTLYIFSWIQLAQNFFRFVNIQDFLLPDCFQSKKLHFVRSQLAILSPRTPLPTARLCTLQHSPSLQVLSVLFLLDSFQAFNLLHCVNHPSLHLHLQISPSLQFSKSPVLQVPFDPFFLS